MCAMSVDHMIYKHSHSHQQSSRKRNSTYVWKFQNFQTGLSGPDNPVPQEFVFASNVQHSVPGPDYWKNHGRIIRSPRKIVLPYRCNNQMSGRIFGKIRAGLSGPADLEVGQSMHTIRCQAGLLQKSGPDYPAQLKLSFGEEWTHAVVAPEYWNTPGRIIRSDKFRPDYPVSADRIIRFKWLPTGRKGCQRSWAG